MTGMRRLGIVLLCAGGLAAEPGFNGRWNITVTGEPRARAWWLEVTGAGTPAIQGRFVGAPGGQMDAIPEISITGDGELVFVFQRGYRRAGDDGQPKQSSRGVYRARLAGGKLAGTFEVEGRPESKLTWSGVRAPEIAEKDDGTWRPRKPVELINGRDLGGWRVRVPGRPLAWKVENGVMKNEPRATDIISERNFWNFLLRAEYRVSKGSNSGIGLRGRYEVQIMEDYGRAPDGHSNGAVYSRIVPSINASLPPDEWQAFDVRLVGRTVTVSLNGKTIIDRKEIEGLTAIASDPNEGEPGPFILQGDHGPVEFRKFTVTPLAK
jgi:hypothetical protein